MLDEHNVEYVIIERIGESTKSLFKRLFSTIESKRLKDFEKRACEKSDLVLTVTDEDKKLLTGLTSKKVNIETVPIGVDIEYFVPKVNSQQLTVNSANHKTRLFAGAGLSAVAGTTNHKPQNTIVFIGTMFWPPNVDGVSWFIKDIWPLVKKKVISGSCLVDSVRLQIIGRRPTKVIKELAEKNKDIELIEYADDIRPYMYKGKVFIVPLRQGSGMRVKILNAFASGIPVVSTIIGAEGIDGLKPVISGSRHDFNIWIADTPEAFAEAVVELINNDTLRETLSNNARKLAVEKYGWDIISNKLLETYESVIRG